MKFKKYYCVLLFSVHLICQQKKSINIERIDNIKLIHYFRSNRNILAFLEYHVYIHLL